MNGTWEKRRVTGLAPRSAVDAGAGSVGVLLEGGPVGSQVRYVTFRLNFHHFDCFELDLRGHSHVRDHSHVRGAAFPGPRLKLAGMVLI